MKLEPAVLTCAALLPWLLAWGVASPPRTAPQAPNPPDPRAHHQLVYHEGEGRTYLLGGSTPRDGAHHYFDEVWVWEEGSWTRGTPLPFPRSSHRVVYHRGRSSLVLFGGGFGRAIRAEGVVWERTEEGWRAVGGDRRAAATEPGMCYDQRRERVVLFGGWSRDGAFRGDTWEWDGRNLARVDTGGPSPRAGHALTYDPVGERCLLFGGRGESGYLDDTWSWDGTDWVRHDVPGPSPRWFFGVATDPEHERVVLFGGRGPDAPVIGRDDTGDLGDTWAWNGRAWERLTDEGPEARSSPRMAPTGTGVLLFGGRVEAPEGFVDRGDTWELRGSAWARAETGSP